MQISKDEAQKAIDDWCQCNIIDLSKNFFGAPSSPVKKPPIITPYTGDLLKVKSLYLNGSDLIGGIEKAGARIDRNTQFRLSFGLRNLNDFELKVMPIFQILNGGERVCDFGFVNPESGYAGDPSGYKEGVGITASGAFQVPKTYLELVTSIWGNSRISKIEDVFTAKVQSMYALSPQLSKLLGYNISAGANANLFDVLVKYLANVTPEFELAFIGFHFGIDLNKADAGNTFSYVTVVEIRLKHTKVKGSTIKDVFAGLHQEILFDSTTDVNVISEDDDDETLQVLYQYMNPCPPFCGEGEG
ncbi:hypothetical protein [Roseivirga pacifica]|uniref:hypothetical protein n=1 Tax=Roseivirga pacifica TaxID=1267423 RepID=UPI003BAD4472